LDNLPIEVYGDGSQVMDMVWVGDVAQTLVSALEYTIEHGTPIDGTVEDIFEAGSGNDTTVKQIATMVNEVAGSTAGIKTQPMRPGEPEHSVVLGDPDTLLNLNLRPFKDLRTGVDETVQWFKAERDKR